MIIPFINKASYLKSNLVSTEQLLEKVSSWSDLQDHPVQCKTLTDLHSSYLDKCTISKKNLNFTFPVEGSDYNLSGESISIIFSDFIDKFSTSNIDVVGQLDQSAQVWNQVYIASLTHPLETLLFVIPCFVYYLPDINILVPLYALFQAEPKMLTTLLQRIFYVDYHRHDPEKKLPYHNPSWVAEDEHKFINWSIFSTNPEEAKQAYLESPLRILMESGVRVVVSDNFPELTLPNEIPPLPNSDIESISSLSEGRIDGENTSFSLIEERGDIGSISSSLEGRNAPQITPPSDIRESNSLVVRDNVPRR